MARARNIKPGFFENEELVELDFSTRLLFIGLWTISDRSGRLEDRPKRIKMALFPADNLDIDAALNDLQKSGFLLRYTQGEGRYIQILSFEKHQNPHKDEKKSTIPAPCLHGADTVQEQDKHDGNPADSLIPDSPIPDSIMGDSADESAPEKKPVRKATQIPADFYPNETGVTYAENKKLSLAVELESFRNFHTAKGSTWKDWQATWRTWCDRAVEYGRGGAQPRQRGSPGYQNIHDKRAETIAILTGKKSNERTIANEHDIAGESRRVAG